MTSEPSQKWADADIARRYARSRFGSSRAAERDPRIVASILEQYQVRPSTKPVLDAPCGTGRLRPVLEEAGLRYVGLDVSPAMIGEARAKDDSDLILGSVAALPFRDDAFDLVLCCRLLHHLHEPEDLRCAVRELVRVSQRLVVASFWDLGSLHGLRARVGLKRSEGPRGRRAVSKRVLRSLFEDAGADVQSFHHSFRFVSQQAFVVARKRSPVRVTVPKAAVGTLPQGALALGKA
jgi:SAM-dependent methyltransferase